MSKRAANHTRQPSSLADDQSDSPEAGGLRRVPYLTSYFIARTVSAAGDAAWLLAIAWEGAAIGGASFLATLLAVSALPRLTLLMIGGGLADLWGIRRTMIGFDFAAAAIAGATFVLWSQIGPHLWFLLASAFLFSTCEAFYAPAAGAFIRQLTPKEFLSKATSLRQSLMSVASLGGTALGGLLIVTGGFGIVALIDCLSFVVIGVMLLRIPTFQEVAVGTKESLLQGIRGSLRYIWRDTFLRFSLLRAALINSLSMALMSVGLVIRVRQQGWGPVTLAMLEIAIAVGTIVSGVWLAKVTTPVRLGLIVSASFVAFSGALGLLIFSRWVLLSIPLALIVGMILVPVAAWGDSLMLMRLPEDRLATLNGAIITVSTAAVPVGSALFGLLAAQFSFEVAIQSFVALLCVGSILCFAITPLRTGLGEEGDVTWSSVNH